MRRLTAGVALVLALTGCVRFTSETTLTEDDRFSQHAVIAMTEQAANGLVQQLGQFEGELPEGAEIPDDALDPTALLDPDAVREQLAPLEELYPGSVEVEPYSDEDGRSGVEITLTDIPLDAADDATGAAPLASSLTMAREGDDYVIELETGAASQLRGVGATAGDLTLIENAVDIGVTFTFPGLVREASAGTIEGSTVTLGLADLLSADSIRIVGGAGDEIDWGPWLRWGLVALAAAVLVGGATALVIQDRRRRSRTALPPPRESSGHGMGTLGDRHEPPAG